MIARTWKSDTNCAFMKHWTRTHIIRRKRNWNIPSNILEINNAVDDDERRVFDYINKVKPLALGGAIKMAFRWQDLVWMTIVILTIVAPHFTAQPPTADDAINKDRQLRHIAVKGGKNIATKPKWGFFGTIFNLILEQVNDTKSAYTQISDLVNGQFIPDNVPTKAPVEINGTTETPKISRSEFLKIIDRNLKGLNRLRNLEWREAKKDTAANLRAYKDELFSGKQKGSKR